MAELAQLNRKDHIRQVAQQLFRQNGYAATSIRRLASEVGIEAGSLYSHVSSKEQILQDICFSMADEFFSAIQQVTENKTEPQQTLQNAIKAHIRVITKNIDASAVFFHDWRYMNEEALSKFKELRHRYESIFYGMVKEGIDKQAFRPVDVKFTVLTIFSAMNWTYEWYKPDGKMDADEIGSNLANIMIKGLKK